MEKEHKENKCLTKAQENKSIRLMEMRQTRHDVRPEFNKETETLEKTQELKNPIAQLENPSRMKKKKIEDWDPKIKQRI